MAAESDIIPAFYGERDAFWVSSEKYSNTSFKYNITSKLNLWK